MEKFAPKRSGRPGLAHFHVPSKRTRRQGTVPGENWRVLCDQWSWRIRDAQPGKLKGRSFLEWFKLREDRQDDLFCRTNDGIRHDSKMQEATSFVDHLFRNRMTFGEVAFGDGLRIALTTSQPLQLPSKVEGILHAGVHTLSTGRTMDVRGIPEQEYAARPISRSDAFVHCEIG